MPTWSPKETGGDEWNVDGRLTAEAEHGGVLGLYRALSQGLGLGEEKEGSWVRLGWDDVCGPLNWTCAPRVQQRLHNCMPPMWTSASRQRVRHAQAIVLNCESAVLTAAMCHAWPGLAAKRHQSSSMRDLAADGMRAGIHSAGLGCAKNPGNMLPREKPLHRHDGGPSCHVGESMYVYVLCRACCRQARVTWLHVVPHPPLPSPPCPSHHSPPPAKACQPPSPHSGPRHIGHAHSPRHQTPW